MSFTLLGVLAAVDNDYNNNKTNFGVVLGGLWLILVGVAWLLAAAGTTYSWLKQRRARHATAKVDAAIREHAPEEASIAAIKQVVSQEVGGVSRELVDQRVRRDGVQRLVAAGADELAANLPSLPRSVKRVANRHYLLASVAIARESVGDGSPITGAQLAKWAVLMERWPTIAAEILRRPESAGELERAARKLVANRDPSTPSGELPETLQGVANVGELLQLLSDPVPLGEVAEQLVYSRPRHKDR